MINFIIGVLVLIYLIKRINALEAKIIELTKGGIKTTQQTTVPSPTPTPSPAPVTTPHVERDSMPISVATPPKRDGATEFALGSKALTGVGVLALILGVTFFLRYAFVNNLISVGMRVAIGAVFGIAICILGHYLRNKYSQYGHTLIGAGLGILYLTSYAAYSFYAIITVIPAFILLCLLTAVGVALALKYNSRPLLGYALAGGFIIPLIMPLSDSVHVLFVYLLVLNIAVLLVARFKIWPELTVASLIFSAVLFISWVVGPYTDATFMPTLGYGTIIFFIYFLTSLLNFVYRDRNYKGIDGFLLYAIPIAYFALMLTIVHGKDETALLAVGIGIFYIVVSLLVRAGFAQIGELKKFSNSLVCVGLPFVALATVLHFEGSTVTIMWALEAVVMVLVGYLLKTPSNRICGVILSMIAGLRMITMDLGTPYMSQAIFNSRSVTVLFVLLTYLVIWKLYNTYLPAEEGIKHDELAAGRVTSAIGLYLTLVIWANLEAHDFIVDYSLYLPIIWMGIVAVMISLGAIAKEKIFRYLSYILLFFAFVFALASLSNLPVTHAWLMNIRVLTALATVALCTYVMWLFKSQKDVFDENEKHIGVTLILATNAIVLWAFSLEILSYFNRQMSSYPNGASLENTKRVALSVFWLAYALGSLAVGIFRRSINVRYASIILFAITIFKIFLYDTANLTDVSRFISFIVLGIILLISGFAYYKFKDRIKSL